MATLANLLPVEGALGEDFEDARWTRITFDLSDVAGEPTVLAKVGTDPYMWHVVYDASGFAPLFAQHSTITDDGAGTYSFDLLPTGGWWGDVELRAGDFSEAV